ncbi:MAG: recombination-associated protein RdgC [Neisseriaceae bacterium]|nr:recombination-associated protein RdgC [Neisseriaceae bacterium]
MNNWFKQLSFFIVPSAEMPSVEELENDLQKASFVPVSGLSRFSEGFSPINAQMVMNVGGQSWRMSLRREDKILPASVVRDALENKIAEIESREQRQMSKKEKHQLKEQITDDFLPRAFAKSSYTELLYLPESSLLLVNQASATRAENSVSLLRNALGGLRATQPNTVNSPMGLMTDWLLSGDAAGNFTLDSDCELKSSGDEAATVRVARQDLTAAEVVQHVKNGKVVTQLGLTWQDRVSFVLNHDLSLKRIRFLDSVQAALQEEGEDPETLAMATQLIISESLAAILGELIDLLGGLATSS